MHNWQYPVGSSSRSETPVGGGGCFFSAIPKLSLTPLGGERLLLYTRPAFPMVSIPLQSGSKMEVALEQQKVGPAKRMTLSSSLFCFPVLVYAVFPSCSVFAGFCVFCVFCLVLSNLMSQTWYSVNKKQNRFLDNLNKLLFLFHQRQFCVIFLLQVLSLFLQVFGFHS